MTPSLACNFRCDFCWRVHPEDVAFPPPPITIWDDPQTIIAASLKAQRLILSGYNSQVIAGKIDPSKYDEALSPRHVAISLDGEPTLYPMIGDLINEYTKNGFTTFLVTNGSNPAILRSLSQEPTQLYLSLYASHYDLFTMLCKPLRGDDWSKVNESLQSLHSFTCPTVVRLTLVKDINMNDPSAYIPLLKIAEPTYIEAKAYMALGYSRRRLPYEAMPSFADIQCFADTLARQLGYSVIASSTDSRVALLSRLHAPQRLI